MQRRTYPVRSPASSFVRSEGLVAGIEGLLFTRVSGLQLVKGFRAERFRGPGIEGSGV